MGQGMSLGYHESLGGVADWRLGNCAVYFRIYSKLSVDFKHKKITSGSFGLII